MCYFFTGQQSIVELMEVLEHRKHEAILFTFKQVVCQYEHVRVCMCSFFTTAISELCSKWDEPPIYVFEILVLFLV